MGKANFYRITIIFSILCLFSTSGWAVDGPLDGEEIVVNLHEVLLTAMKSEKSLGYAGRMNIIRNVVSESFNFPLISKVVLGEKWEVLSDEDKQQFVSAMRWLSISTYAHHFSSYSGQKFVIVARKSRNNSLSLSASLLSDNGDRTSLKYLLRKNTEGWLIVNVISEGVSDLALKKAEYSYIMEKDGIKSLLRQLTTKIEALKELG
jgi:phospholipid transport system substrate-binding protein